MVSSSPKKNSGSRGGSNGTYGRLKASAKKKRRDDDCGGRSGGVIGGGKKKSSSSLLARGDQGFNIGSMFKRDTKKDKRKKSDTSGKSKATVAHSARRQSSSSKIKLSYSEHREAKASAKKRNNNMTSTTAATINGRRREEEEHGKSRKGAGSQLSFRMKLPTEYNNNGRRGGLFPSRKHRRFTPPRNDNLQQPPPWYNAELIEQCQCNTTTDTGNINSADTSTPTSINAPTSSSLLLMLQQQQQQQQLLLPSQKMLRQLDYEIYAFVSYVRLSNTEQLARWDFVRHVTDICQRQFTNINGSNSNNNNGSSRSSNNINNNGGRRRDYYYDDNQRGWKSGSSNNNSNNKEGGGVGGGDSISLIANEAVRVIPFGSFMTLDVCTFESDVDMCLWGVVPPDDDDDDDKQSSTLHSLQKKPPSPWTSSSSSSSCIANNELLTAIGINNNNANGGGDGCPLLTESSLLRTMDAIQTAAIVTTNNNNNNNSNSTTTTDIKRKDQTIDDQQRKQEMTTTTTKKSKRSSGVTNNDNGDATYAGAERNDNLFFIDRVGDQAAAIIDLCNDGDDDDANDDDANAIVTATTFSTTSSATINNSVEEEEIIEQIIRTQETIERIMKKSNSTTMIPDSSTAVVTTASATASSSTNMTDDFQFIIDKEGVKEFGGFNDEDEENDKVEDQRVIDDLLGHAEGCEALSSSAAAAATTTSSTGVTIDGKSTQGTIVERNDDGSYIVAIDDGNEKNDDSDDDDSADKLSSYYQRRNNRHDDITTTSLTKPSSLLTVICHDNVNTSDDENEYSKHNSSDGDSSDEDDGSIDSDNELSLPSKTDAATTNTATPSRYNMEVMELSVTSNNNNTQAASVVVGPRGKTRTRVVSTLLCLTRQLRMSSHYVHTIECRTKARVPIINCSTRMGFEGDIAIGGHNGVDTSMYARAQSARYCSFAPVVVVLKIIMSQQGLDKPFTGGLGSYKLYVLVAYHIKQHLELGGNDRPSEILISLLIRYGGDSSSSGRGLHRNPKENSTTTDLEKLKSREEVLRCDGGTVELTPVFRLSDCVDMFHECYNRLLLSDTTDDALMSARKTATVPPSYLSRIIDCRRLREARETSERRSRMSENSNNSCSRQYLSSTVIPSTVPPPENVNNDSRTKPGGMKRGPRGGIIPKYRPDLMAAAATNQQDHNLLQRATKNRKNKKKQKRDAVVKEYASAYINDDNIFR